MISKQEIKFIRSLQQKKCRDENRLYVIEGIKMVNEAIKMHGSDIELLTFIEHTADKLLLHKLPNGVKSETVAEADFKKISSLKTPQGALAVLKQPKRKLPGATNEHQISLVLDSIRDPGNMGTIIRIADWFGIKHIYCSADTVECYNPKVIQASMGAIFRVDVHYINLVDFFTHLSSTEKVHVYGTSLDGENLYTTDISTPAFIVMGNEANGISDQLASICHNQLRIPDYGTSEKRSESLNVSVATGILCAEFKRRMS